MGRTERARTLYGIHVAGPFAWLMMQLLKTVETRVDKAKHPVHLGGLPAGSDVLLLRVVDLQYLSNKGGRSAIFE